MATDYLRRQSWDPEPQAPEAGLETLRVGHQQCHISPPTSTQRFVPFTNEGPQRYLQACLPCHPPSSLSQELFLGQDADQGFDSSEAVGALGLLPITLTALPHCFPL